MSGCKVIIKCISGQSELFKMKFFNKIVLQTPESVELEFRLAGIGNRTYALTIDYIIWAAILIISLIVFSVANYYLDLFDGDRTTLWAWAIQLIIFFIIYVGYFVFFEVLWRGQTPGKRLVKIRVIRDDGRSVGLLQATLRALLRPFDDILCLGIFLIIFSKTEKRLGDFVAGTIVIQEETAIKAQKLVVSPDAESLAEYLRDKTNLDRLSPEDFATVGEYLQRQKEMLPAARLTLAKKLAYRLKNIIGLEEVPENVTATTFLEAIYLAYRRPF
jgi:uncharacterized RDD family membrane protein YckC